MIKYGQVIDANTGLGVPYATIEITDQAGTYTGAGVSAGATGNFAIDSLQIKPGSFMRISSAGYKTTSIPYLTYTNKDTFTLIPAIVDLDEIVITAKRTADTNKNAILYAGLGLAALFFLLRKK